MATEIMQRKHNNKPSVAGIVNQQDGLPAQQQQQRQRRSRAFWRTTSTSSSVVARTIRRHKRANNRHNNKSTAAEDSEDSSPQTPSYSIGSKPSTGRRAAYLNVPKVSVMGSNNQHSDLIRTRSGSNESNRSDRSISSGGVKSPLRRYT